ncbi:MAG: hypothetical protein ABSH42_04275 [Bryobacteraceae bacterium]|jgi:hypothetical protein
MSRWIKLVGMVLAVSAVGFGQTWQGLGFGWPLRQVQEALSKKGFHLVRLDGAAAHFRLGPGHQEWDVQPVFDLQLPSILPPLHFVPDLVFTSTDKLERITLRLAAEKHAAEGMDTALLAALAAAPIQRELSIKYGAPVSMAGACGPVSTSNPADGSGKVSCDAVWRAEGQGVSLEWEYFPGSKKFFLSISYSPFNPGL